MLIAVFRFLFGKEIIPLDVLLSNFFMVQDIFHKDTMSGVYWTLLIEVKFYLFLALQHFLMRRRGILITLAVLVGLNIVIWLNRGHASLLLTFFPAFYVGIEIRRADASCWSRSAMLRLIGVTIVVTASLLAFDDYYAQWSAVYVLCEVAMLVMFLRVDVSSAIFGFFGRISYSHYLYHASLGYFFLALIPASPSPAFNIVVIMLAIALTTGIAFISYRFVEVPAVAFGKRCESLWMRVPAHGLK